jgi:hypothetical protein
MSHTDAKRRIVGFFFANRGGRPGFPPVARCELLSFEEVELWRVRARDQLGEPEGTHVSESV